MPGRSRLRESRARSYDKRYSALPFMFVSHRLSDLLALPDVTLVSVTGVKVDAAHAALRRCISGLDFAQTLLISSERPTVLDSRIKWIEIPPMTLNQYSAFILKELYKHIDTSHVLISQADGFVVNPGRWDPKWLEFDYLGAPFRRYIHAGNTTIEPTNRVGNGGFSLRTRRLLELTSPIDLATLRYPTRAEDMIICHLLYDYLVGKGITFADPPTAARFSIMHPSQTFGQTLDTAFGFHGEHYLAELEARERSR